MPFDPVGEKGGNMRRLMALGAAAVVGAVLFMGAPALAATPGYPPPTVGTPPPTTVLTATSVTCPVGSTCTITFTGFLPGSTVQIFLAGQLAATVTVPASGSFTVTVAVTDPHISINGGPLIAVPYGANSVTATGTAASGQPGSVSGTVTIPSPATNTGTGGTTGAAGSSGAAGTSGRPGTSGTASTTASTGGLAFTGAQIGMMVGGGLILLVAGTGLVLATRQRRSSTI